MRPGNKFERFRVVLQLISRFEFDFRRCGFFFERFDFWCVQSSITHNVAVHVHVLWPLLHPHNSISNVVASLTIHDNKNISKRCSKKHETIVEGQRFL